MKKGNKRAVRDKAGELGFILKTWSLAHVSLVDHSDNNS